MPDTSPILGLPFLQPAQAQKHVTHNEALRALDMISQLTVAEFDAITPPAIPQSDTVYALGSGASGVWAGHDNDLAIWRDTAWHFVTPQEGWRAWGKLDDSLRIWDGSAWGLPTIDLDNLSGVGVNTSSDATNRLSVSSDASLFSHDGTDHQIKVNKATTGDTASVLFQTGWSGRAEFGLTGDDDFVIKTSADGASWTNAISIDHTTGYVAIGSSSSDYPMTITAPGDDSPIALRLNNWSGSGSTIAAARGLVLSADHDDNSSAQQSFMGFEVNGQEYMQIGNDGTISAGISAAKPAMHIKNILRIEPGAAPSSPSAGDVYFDSTTSKLRCYDGSIWQDLF